MVSRRRINVFNNNCRNLDQLGGGQASDLLANLLDAGRQPTVLISWLFLIMVEGDCER